MKCLAPGCNKEVNFGNYCNEHCKLGDILGEIGRDIIWPGEPNPEWSKLPQEDEKKK